MRTQIGVNMKVNEIVGIKKIRRILLIVLVGALSLHLSIWAIWAATERRSNRVEKYAAQGSGETIKINSRLVEVPVSVTDVAGHPVRNLTAEDFQLEEEGKRQQVVSLGNPGKTPVEIALLFDITGSVFDLFQFQRQAPLRFLKEALKPNDAVSIFTIGVRPKLVRSRVVGVNKAIAAAQSIQPTKQATSFFDTVVEAARYLGKTAAPGARRVIVVISDGEDMLSENYGLSDAMKELQRFDCLFYSINPSGPSIRLNKISARDRMGWFRWPRRPAGRRFFRKALKI